MDAARPSRDLYVKSFVATTFAQRVTQRLGRCLVPADHLK